MEYNKKELGLLAQITEESKLKIYLEGEEKISITEEKQLYFSYIADKFLDIYQPKCDYNTKEFWIYSNGIWINDGERILKQRIRFINKLLSRNAIAEILDKIFIDSSFIEFPFNKRNILVFQNVTLDLDEYVKDKEFIFEQNRTFMSTVKLPYSYDENATCPKIEQFFNQVSLENKEFIITLHEFASDCLTNHYKSQVMLLNYGEGNNGKGVYARLLEHLLGSENITSIGVNSLMDDSFQTHLLRNSRLNIIGDYSNKFVQDSGFIKKMTGQDRISCPVKYATKPIEFTNKAKMLISGQYVLNSSEDTDGWYRRFKFLEWKYKVKVNEINKDFEDELFKEVQGWFNTILKYYKNFYHQNFHYSVDDSQNIENNKFRIELRKNPVKIMVELFCDFEVESQIPVRDLYNAVCQLIKDYKIRPITINAFSRKMSPYKDIIERSRIKNEDGSQTKIFKGIKFNTKWLKDHDPFLIEKKMGTLENNLDISISDRIIHYFSLNEFLTIDDIKTFLFKVGIENCDNDISSVLDKSLQSGFIYEPMPGKYKLQG